MKKQLVLLSALAMAGVASAQSSVTLFGVVDATLAVGKGSVADRTQLSRGGLTTPRLGFRGTEDLGGGLKAGFWLEAGANTDDGTGGATNTNNQATGSAGSGALTFARRSTISLSGNWGELRLGRDFVPQYNNMVAGDVFGNVGVGASINYTAIITGVVAVRASNQIQYFSPNLSGFTVNVGHWRGENLSTAANDEDGTGTGIRVNYNVGPLTSGLGYGVTEYAAGDVKQSNVHLGYNFGVARVVGTYNRDENGASTGRGGSIGAAFPVGAGEFRAGYSQYKISTGAATPKARKYAIGYVHNLSKRTAVYGTYARVHNSGGASFALNGSSTSANGNSSGLDLGVRHSF